MSACGVGFAAAADESTRAIVEIQGHRIDSVTMTCANDVTGEVTLKPTAEHTLDVSVVFQTSSGIAEKHVCGVSPIRETTKSDEGLEFVKIDVSSYRDGLFVDIRLLANGSAMVYVAADIDDTQYSALGLLSRPLTVPAVETRLEDVKDALAIRLLKEERVPSTSAVVIYNDRQKPLPNGPSCYDPLYVPSGPRVYCLVHEVFFDDNNSVPEQVGAWCVSYSWVDYSVYREDVSEAQIKSDLQFYNKKHYTIDTRSRIVGAYEIDIHGDVDTDEPDRPLMTFDGGWLYPSEVESLWGPYSQDYYIRPDNTIMLASACQSLWNSGETSGSEMGDVFINYGATAYVGSTVNLPIVMDDWTEEFWWSLSYQDQTISDAISDANLAMGWARTSTYIQVYLSSYGTRRLPN